MYVLDNFKTQEMCDKAVTEDAFFFICVPYWFVTRQQVRPWHDDDDDDDNWVDELIKWYEGYNKLKAQKAKIKQELMSIAWHPPGWQDWCVP